LKVEEPVELHIATPELMERWYRRFIPEEELMEVEQPPVHSLTNTRAVFFLICIGRIDRFWNFHGYWGIARRLFPANT